MSRKLANLRFDSADYVCLKLLLLLDPEVPTLTNQSLVQKFNEQVWQTLHEYCSYSRVPDKFNQLLNLLPDFRYMGQCGVDFLYFKHRQSHAPQASNCEEWLKFFNYLIQIKNYQDYNIFWNSFLHTFLLRTSKNHSNSQKRMDLWKINYKILTTNCKTK